MKIHNIGETITVTNGNTGKTYNLKITGRNWAFDELLSYMVNYNGVTMPINPKNMRFQIISN